MTLLRSLLLSCVVFVSSTSAFGQPPPEALENARLLSSAFEKVADMITPSVVNVSSVKRVKPGAGLKPFLSDPFFEQFREFFGDEPASPFQNPEGYAQEGLGTGVVIDDRGYILTNNHVVGDADEVEVRLHNGQKFKAERVGSDPRTDLAVIRIKAKGLVGAKLGDSDKLRIGEWVVAAGNPFGLDNTITAGIVSAKGRSIMGGGQFEDFIQTDAAINPGNSGGPLVNLVGEVVGINTAIYSRSGGYMGIGFAIPINMARTVADSLITKGKVVRGWLGVGIQNLTEDLAQSFNYPGTNGALISHVDPKGPAAKAGLKQGDIIISVQENKIDDTNELRNIIAQAAPGSRIELELVRNGRKQSVDVKVGELPAEVSRGEAREEQPQSSVDLGLGLEDLTPSISRRYGFTRSSGVLVEQVRPGSMADHAGIQARDIILSVDGKEVESVRDFYTIVEDLDFKKGVRMVVENDGFERFVILKAGS